MSPGDNKLIFKNSLFLYVRTLVLMIISLYTSRVVLNALGESDYGVYSVVGGVVVMLSFINSALTSATQRYLNIALGTRNDSEIKKVFNTSLQVHIIISIAVFILAETVGLWFLVNYLNIPPHSRVAAHWVFQFSVITTILGILSSPYNAVIIAHERMSIFAYLSLFEGSLKLFAALAILAFTNERLILYAAFICGIAFLIRFLYNLYCIRHFKECRGFSLKMDSGLLKEMFSFSGWSLFGTLGNVGATQGMAMILNIFFGTIVNAAISIANQVNSAVYQMIYGFLQAIRPQIMKSYASSDFTRMHMLVIRGSKMALLLTGLAVYPIILEVDYILTIWLKNVPPFTSSFVIIMLLLSLVNSFMLILVAAQEATGRIRNFQLISIISSLMYLPIAWYLYHLGYPPYYGLWTNLALGTISQIIRLIIVHLSIGLKCGMFVKNAILPFIGCSITALLIPVTIKYCLASGALNAIMVITTCVFTYILSTYFIALSNVERNYIKRLVISKLKKG